MRQYREFTARNLLRRPLVFGVPLIGILGLSFCVLALSLLIGDTKYGNPISIAFACFGYATLRVFTHFGKPGWDEALSYRLAYWRLHRDKQVFFSQTNLGQPIGAESPDTFDEPQLLIVKEGLREKIERLKPDEILRYICRTHGQAKGGVTLHEVRNTEALEQFGKNERSHSSWHTHFYTLHQLPVFTDPLWLFAIQSKLKGRFEINVTFRGLNQTVTKKRLEVSRKSNARLDGRLMDIDSEVTFTESSRILEGVSRGDECLVEASFCITSDTPQELDQALFVEDTHTRDKELALLSAQGLRKRFFRPLMIRSVTASDLVPSFGDPLLKNSYPLLSTIRGNSFFFNPLDSRLEALHWVVVGASGTGKSFFTGCILNRMLTHAGNSASILFLDHNRSYQRYVTQKNSPYLEPTTLTQIERSVPELFDHWNTPGTVSGIELSDLDLSTKKDAAFKVLSLVEIFLRYRRSTHPFYVVLDECWQWMRDEPVMVQRAFREYRKLNGAVIAITQSLSDLLTDQSGQSIFQNAPVRILLRQGEDLTPYKAMLGLNEVELAKTRLLRQSKGEFSECLIKTPFMSTIGRLYPTEAEYALFRTDNLREELIAKSDAAKQKEAVCSLQLRESSL